MSDFFARVPFGAGAGKGPRCIRMTVAHSLSRCPAMRADASGERADGNRPDTQANGRPRTAPACSSSPWRAGPPGDRTWSGWRRRSPTSIRTGTTSSTSSRAERSRGCGNAGLGSCPCTRRRSVAPRWSSGAGCARAPTTRSSRTRRWRRCSAAASAPHRRSWPSTPRRNSSTRWRRTGSRSTPR